MSEALARPEAGLGGDANPRHSLPEDVARLTDRIREEIEAKPMLAVAAALCVGFALGGGVSRGALTLLLGVGARAAGSRLGDAILEHAPRFRAAQEDPI